MAESTANNTPLSMLPEVAATRFAQELPLAVVMLKDVWATRELRLCVRNWEALSSHAR